MSDDNHSEHGHGHGEAVYPYTPHHFHAAKQHFESGKMGVWLFLVTEILFFAGLFCAYTVYRSQHPEVFYWAHFYLDTFWGAANTVVLILSSFTAAWAVRNAQLAQTKLLRLNIILTICGALFFMCVKFVEYKAKFEHGTLPAGHFHPHEEVWELHTFKHKHPEAAEAAERIVAGIAARKGTAAAVSDTVVGDGPKMQLIPVQDAAKPVAAEEKTTSAPAPEVKTTVAVQPASAAPAQEEPETTAGPGAEEAAVLAGQVGVEQGTSAQAAVAEGAVEEGEEAKAAVPEKQAEKLSDEAWLERQIQGLSAEERHPLEMAGVIRRPVDGPLVFERPARAGVFFSIYFFMTGLHGLHVVIGIGLWLWMLAIVARRQMGPKYFGPIEFTALYWHLVDLIWIYLFPMLYLIH